MNETDFEGDDQRFQFSFRKREREFEGEESYFILFYFILYIYNFDDLGKCECLNYLRASYHEVKKRLEISIL